MAQTKRKRRTKHRGTAAGTIEARGRTGRKPEGAEARKPGTRSRTDPRLRVPTWRGAVVRAAFAALLLRVLFQIGLGPEMSFANAALLAIIALSIYIPLGYATDRFVYNRRMRKLGRAPKR